MQKMTFVYECRRCGKVETRGIVSSEMNAALYLKRVADHESAVAESHTDNNIAIALRRHAVHDCPDGALGLSDLVGAVPHK